LSPLPVNNHPVVDSPRRLRSRDTRPGREKAAVEGRLGGWERNFRRARFKRLLSGFSRGPGYPKAFPGARVEGFAPGARGFTGLLVASGGLLELGVPQVPGRRKASLPLFRG